MDDGFDESARGAQERADYVGVELRPGAALKLRGRLLVADGRAVGAHARHRVEGVGHGDDPRVKIYLLAAQARRIPPPVPPLVVFGHHAAHPRRRADPEHQAGAVREVEARQRAYLDVIRKRDLEAIGQFFADDYTYTSENGVFMTKAQRLEAIKTNPRPASIDFKDLKVRVYGDTAVVTGRVMSEASPDGQAINNRTMWVWVKQGGTWRLVAVQGTRNAAAQ